LAKGVTKNTGNERRRGESHMLIIGDPGCVDMDTEYLSQYGWKKISDYQDGDLVMQYNSDGTSELVKPLKYIKRKEDNLNLYKTKYGISQCISDDHRIIYLNKGLKLTEIKFNELKNNHFNNTTGFRGKIITTFKPKITTTFPLTDEQLRVQVAFHADGNISSKNMGRINIKRQRKILRLRKLLNEANIKYKEKQREDGFSVFTFKPPIMTKTYGLDWFNCSDKQLSIISEECINWDGHRDKQRVTYFSDFIQYVWSSQGYRATIRADIRDYTYKSITKPKCCYYVMRTKVNKITSMIKRQIDKYRIITPYKTLDGYSYCFNVPSGMLVLRRNGNINITGNCGKTAMLQNVQKRAFNCRLTDGKSTSKAGIVATVNKEKNSEQWQVEAGDMVLANNGYLIIDESEKMSSDDIKVLHRPMEQGEAVISKAGTHATLSTRTAVLSVANPKTGRFQDNESIIKQVDFSSSFLSRFDLIYVLRDNPNKDEDELTISKIVNTHKGVMEGTLSQEFMKKYFMYVSKLRPELTTEAGERIIKTYVHLRDLSKKDGRTVGIPISPRYGETLIRLSEAHAKIRLSDKVEIVDVGIAEKLLTRSLSDFGVNLQLGVIDTSSVTTIVPLSKVTEYRLVLETLRKIAETTDNIFETKEVLPKLSLQLGMSIENLEKNIEMARGNGELYFPRTHTFKLLLD
jgi:DNA replicative helicase MCM subunit Mcm2 (Cdc46/Mcm family)